MIFTVIISCAALVLGCFNFYYTYRKDRVQKVELEVKECIETLKKALNDTIENENKDPAIHICYVGSLRYLNIASNNNLQKDIVMFAQSISDFNQKIISTEDFTSQYETIIEKIYTSKEMAIMSIDESCSKNIFNKLQNSYKQKIKEW